MSKEINGWWLPTKDQYFHKFVVDNQTRKRNGFCRENLEQAFKFVSNWRTAIDIGAHVGFWARDMREHFAHVHCFEPAEDVWACLVKNMASTTMSLCTILPLAKRRDIARYATIRVGQETAARDLSIPVTVELPLCRLTRSHSPRSIS